MTDSVNWRARAGLAGAVALIVGIQLYRLLLWSPAELTRYGFLIDDSFFYSVLAKNFWLFGRLTFDGQMPTNGVQPLWMWTQIVLARVFPHVETAILLVRSTWCAYTIFSFLTVWFVARGPTIAAVLRTLLVSGLILLNVGFQVMVVQGLETSLFLIVLVTALIMCDAWLFAGSHTSRQPLSRWRAISLGSLTSLCFLARTDTFWIFLVVGAWIAWRAERPAAALLAFGTAGAVLIVPYLANNIWTHGALMPISGRAKLFYLNAFFPTRTSYLASDEWQALFHAVPVLVRLPATVTLSMRVSVTLLLIAAGILAAWQLHRAGRIPTSIAILSCAVLAHILFMQVAYKELREYSSYYFVGDIWWLAITLTLWISPSARGLRQGVAAAAAVGVMSFAMVEWRMRKFEPSTYWTERVNLSEDIGRLPSEVKVGAFWPGCFAGLSGHEITPLDGIIGSNEYLQNYVKPGREFDYIREQKIEYIAVYLPEAPAAILSRNESPDLSFWSYINIRRLWENRSTPISVAAKRTFGGGDVGWYLLRIGR